MVNYVVLQVCKRVQEEEIKVRKRNIVILIILWASLLPFNSFHLGKHIINISEHKQINGKSI